jgi:hypothetical protein
VPASRDGISSNQRVVKDSQAGPLSNPETATENFVRTERFFCKHEPNCFIKTIRQGHSGPRTTKQIGFPCGKRLRHLFTVGRASASGPYTDSSSARISFASSPRSVNKRITARCSISFLHTRIRLKFHTTLTWQSRRDNRYRSKRKGSPLPISIVDSLNVPAGLEIRGNTTCSSPIYL